MPTKYEKLQRNKKSWGKECVQFNDMLTYLKNTRGISNKELLFASYAIQDPFFWMIDVPWSKKEYRFFLEQAFTWIRIYKILEASNSRAEFLDTIGISEDELAELIPTRSITRESLPAVAAKLNKTEAFQATLKHG